MTAMSKAKYRSIVSDSSSASSSSVGGKRPAPKPAPEPPSKPKSGPPIGGTSPSKPKPPPPAPPKAPNLPNLPKLPKPKSGWEPPKGSLPGYTPGQPPYHGSGGHLPIGDGGHKQGNGKASSTDPCTHPAGMARLRCQKADAIFLTLFAIIALILTPCLIYLCIRSCKQKKKKKKDRDEEDAIELTPQARNYNPDPRIDRETLYGNSDIGLAITTSEETVTLAKEQAQDTNSGSSPAENPSQVCQPRTMNLSPERRGSQRSPVYPPRSSFNRGRRRFRAESMESVASSLSSGMIRTAMVGEVVQDATIIDMSPSLANSRKNSERTSSCSDADISNDGDDNRS